MANRLQIENKLDTMNGHLGTMNENLHKMSLAIGGEIEKPSTWEEIRILCRNNKIKGLLEIGDTVQFSKDGVKYDAVVMDFIEEGQHSNGLKLKDGLQTGVIFQTKDIIELLQFDAQEAFYCAESGLSAGTYNFTVGEHSWKADEVGKTYQFTLTRDLAKGGQLVFTNAYNATFNNAKINVFTDGSSTSAIEQATMTEGSDGTILGTIRNSIQGSFNSCQRAFFGSNNWKESAIRQYLNSDSATTDYWSPKTKWDRPPSWRTTVKGFLDGIQKELKDNIASVLRHTYRNTLSDGGGLDETTEKIFLASRKEVYMPAEGADDTEPFAYYKEGSEYTSPSVSADAIRVKKGLNTNATYYWWLESPYVGTATSVRGVNATGADDYLSANSTRGVAPAFVIA